MPLDLTAQRRKRQTKGCRRCGAPITVYITAGGQRASDKVRVGSASGSFCDEHAVAVFDEIEAVILRLGEEPVAERDEEER